MAPISKPKSGLLGSMWAPRVEILFTKTRQSQNTTAEEILRKFYNIERTKNRILKYVSPTFNIYFLSNSKTL